MNLEIRIATKAELNDVSALSFKFEKEGSCYGLVHDEPDHYTMDVFIAVLDGKIVGYAYGEFSIKDHNTQDFFKKGDKVFYLDEIFVLPEYRSLGIGSKLFKANEEYAKAHGAVYFDLVTATKNYEKAFNFYQKMMGLNYWSASFIKKI